MSTVKRVAVGLLALLAVVVIAGCAGSTPGVRVIGPNTIELPVNETAVFTASSGEHQLRWTVTFDGESEVTFSCSGVCFDGSAHVPNLGDADWANSSSWYGRFDVTRTTASTVNIYWPYGVSLKE